MRTRTVAILGFAAATMVLWPVLDAHAANGYRVSVTCSVPRAQPERQLAPDSCLNYVPDGTQTYTAHVRDSNGKPVKGVAVTWSDSDTNDALFRLNQTPCTTDAAGNCSAELVDRHPGQGSESRSGQRWPGLRGLAT